MKVTNWAESRHISLLATFDICVSTNRLDVVGGRELGEKNTTGSPFVNSSIIGRALWLTYYNCIINT